MCWITDSGGFKICPQIFRNTSFQEVRLNFPPLECGLDLATHLIARQKWQCMLLPELGYQEHCNFLLTHGMLAWLESAAMQRGCSSSLMKRITWQESQASLTTACVGAILTVTPSSPNQDVQRPQPTSWPPNQIRQLNRSWTPDPQKLWNNKYSLLVEVTHFGISCYQAIHSWCTDKYPLAMLKGGRHPVRRAREHYWMGHTERGWSMEHVVPKLLVCWQFSCDLLQTGILKINEYCGTWLSITLRKNPNSAMA